ncbi:hypothetical protein Tco_1352497 [Tanacetum coccineum]
MLATRNWGSPRAKKKTSFSTYNTIAYKTMNRLKLITLRPKKKYMPWCTPFENSVKILSCPESIEYTTILPIKYLFAKKDAKQDSCGKILLLQEFDMKIETQKELRISPLIILSRLENPQIKTNTRTKKSIEAFPSSKPWFCSLQDQSTHGLQILQTTIAGKFVIQSMTS